MTPSGANGGFVPLDCFVVVSKDPLVIMREYARITGLPEMPPLWSFGYQQSHRTLAGPDEIMWVAKTMRDKKLPCDALRARLGWIDDWCARPHLADVDMIPIVSTSPERDDTILVRDPFAA